MGVVRWLCQREI